MTNPEPDVEPTVEEILAAAEREYQADRDRTARLDSQRFDAARKRREHQ